MKNFKQLVLLFLVATATLTSCNKDDETSIEGKWQLSKVGSVVDNVETLEDYEHSIDCNKDYVEFAPGGIYNGFFYDVDDTTTCEEYFISGTWSKNGNIITNTLDGEISPAEILELSDSTLKIKYVDDFDGSIEITVFTRI